MIVSKETAHRIWVAHQEIETARKLLDGILKTEGMSETPLGRGTRNHYQLGVPSGAVHRLFFVGPELAAQMLNAHIANMEAQLNAASIDALRELDDPANAYLIAAAPEMYQLVEALRDVAAATLEGDVAEHWIEECDRVLAKARGEP